MRRSNRRSPKAAFIFLSTCVSVSMATTFGTYVLFLQGIGLTPLEINLVNFAFYASRFLLEVPTGAIADVFGRRISFLVSCFLYAAGLVLYGVATDIGGCILAEVVLAIGSTCASGAFEAWAVDELHAADQHSEVEGMLSKEGFLKQIGVCVGAPIGGIAAAMYGTGFAWFLAAIGFALVGLMAFFVMKETRVSERVGTVRGALLDTARSSVRYSTAPGDVRKFLLLGALFTFAVQAPNMQWAQRFGSEVGGMAGAGMLFTFMALAIAVGSLLVPVLSRLLRGEVTALRVMLGIAGVTLVLTVSFAFPYAIAPFLLYELANGAIKVLRSSSINRAIVSKDRATILSCENMTSQMGGAMGLIATGMLAQYAGGASAWILGGLAMVLAAVTLRKGK